MICSWWLKLAIFLRGSTARPFPKNRYWPGLLMLNLGNTWPSVTLVNSVRTETWQGCWKVLRINSETGEESSENEQKFKKPEAPASVKVRPRAASNKDVACSLQSLRPADLYLVSLEIIVEPPGTFMSTRVGHMCCVTYLDVRLMEDLRGQGDP